jgi:tetratricopeptide (TPR) repeat protein
MTRCILRVLTALLLAGPALASEADDERARELYENGRMLFEEGLYDDAIAAWQAAWELSERPLLLFNIASAQEMLGELEAAVDTLNRYRAFAPADERVTLERRIRNLEARIAEGGSATSAGEAAGPPTGEATAEVGAPDTSQPDTSQPDTSQPDTSQPGTSQEATVERRGRAGPIALFSVSVAGTATGAVFAARAVGAREEALSLCAGSDPYTCPVEAADALSRDQVSSGLADLGFALGVAGAVGGLVAWRAGAADVSLQPGGLVVSGRF